MEIYVFGHKNPDTDSVCSSIAYSFFLNKTGLNTKAMLLGKLRKEAEFVLDYFKVGKPEILKNLKIQVANLNYDRLQPLSENTSIDGCFSAMEKNKIHSLPVVDSSNKLVGVVSMSDIAKFLMSIYKDFDNIPEIFVKDLVHTSNIKTFYEDDYLEDAKEIMLKTNYRNYPVITKNGEYLGLLGRRHLISPGRKKVVLLDHNESHQSAYGIEEAEIIAILDHHKIGDIKTVNPIRFINLPVGSSCTIVFQQFQEQNMDIPFEIAGLLLSGIISDTLLFKSPTCTKSDISAAEKLNEILNIDINDYAKKMFTAGTSLKGMSIEEIIFNDFKEFTIFDKKMGISQIFTLDFQEIENKRDSLIEYIDSYARKSGYYIMLVAVTDILNEGSYLYYYSADKNIITNAFSIKNQGDFSKLIVSRKKQIVPQIYNYIENSKV